jgi:glycosyltransferase involved in cell wall biosynthesis/predicted O-methyltransferase YrrM
MKKIYLTILSLSLHAHIYTFDQVKDFLSYPKIEDIITGNNLDSDKAQQIVHFLKMKESKSVQSWCQWYYALAEIINDNNLRKGIEVGVAFGTNSIYLLENTPIMKLISIDPYREFSTSQYNDGMNFEQKKHDVLFQIVQHRLASFGNRSELLRKTSIEASEHFEDEEFDFVYIDGNHSYESVKKDLEVWWLKIRPGGFLAGDDFCHPNHPGVTKAVNEFAKEKEVIIHRKEGVPHLYWIKKSHVLSFIIPVYNRAKDVTHAIDSIYQQELSIPFEVICTDDGSTDNSLSVLQKYSQKYNNFHYYQHSFNKGASEARNTCIKHAKGDLIFNLDSDNILVPNTIQILIDLIDHTNCDMAAFEKMKYFDENNRHKQTISFQTNNNIFDIRDMLKMLINPLASGNYLFTKKSHSIAGGYHGNVLETWIFGWRQLSKGFKLAIAPGLHYKHCIKPDSKWCKMQKLNLNDKAALETLQSTPELFDDETNILLKNYNVNKRKILNDLTDGTLKLIPEEALKHIFKAYKFEQSENNKRAIKEYLKIKKMGLTTQAIKRKIKTL